MSHPDQLDPENCVRCRKAPMMGPRSHEGQIRERSDPSRELDLIIGCHWDDPEIPAGQLDRWDALATEIHALARGEQHGNGRYVA